MKLAVQTFTIRKHLKSPKDIDQSFKKLMQLGVEAVELAYMKFTPQNIEAVKVASVKYGIEIGSTQITYKYLLNNFDWVVKFHQILACNNTCISVLPDKYKRGSEDQLISFAHQLNDLASRYQVEGINMLYHHHHYEFKHFNKKLGFEILANAMDKKLVGLVLDTYWLQRGGVCPHEYIEKYGDRVKVVHLRDFEVVWKGFNLQQNDTELGNGNLDFVKIMDACRKAGVQYGAIEQDCKLPFDSLELSIKHFISIK